MIEPFASTTTKISSCLGWAYFLAWTISFYPQVFLNVRRKSVEGLSIDFIYLNVAGFTSYVLYTTGFMFNEDVREEYRRRHDRHDNSVQPNDVAYAIHALVICTIICLQTFYYPRAPGQRLSPFNRLVISAMVIFSLVSAGRVAIFRTHLIDVLYHLGTFKLYVSLGKYVPQAWSNFKRKSTEGWSLGGVWLMLIGGVLSLLQLLIDSVALDDWSSITGNPVKFGLSTLVLGFGVLFIVQHYMLYCKKQSSDQGLSNNDNSSRSPLLG